MDMAALFALSLLGLSWIWWALDEGAYLQSVPYFNSVLYPAIALVAAGMIVMIWTAPWRASLALSSPARLALFGLVALAGWSLASALWTPTPDIAVSDSQRILLYALVFGLGIWSCILLGRRMELAMAPLAGAALVVGLVTLVGLATGSNAADYLDLDGTLEFPLGYRNATAAFFGIALWPALGLASSTRVASVIRVGAGITAAICIEVNILTQSRGAILGALAAVAVYFVFSPHRIRAAVWLAAAALPALASLPAASAIYDAAKETTDLSGVDDEMNSAAVFCLAMLPVTIGLALAALKADRHFEAPRWLTPERARVVAAGGALVVAIGMIAVIGNPVTWVDDKVDEFSQGDPDLTDSSSRFTFNAGSDRTDVWRVALDAAAEDPIFGEGAGGFQFRYNRERANVKQLARDAHSVWLETLSELGAVGLGLLVVVVVGAYAGALRARRLGPAAAQLACAAMAAGAFWLAHASVDWFWPFPAVSGPPIALLGAAVGPALILPGRARPRKGHRLVVVALLGALIVSVIPPYLSERLMERSFSSFRADTAQAYDDLDLARALNPLSDSPYLAEGAIAMELGDTERAIAAYRKAADKRPQEYAARFFLALLYAETDPDLARRQLAVATELNPLAPDLMTARQKINRAEDRRVRQSSRGEP
jgi:tetratricopeptide (TPR) repeat protein